jgi:hypothetical protein
MKLSMIMSAARSNELLVEAQDLERAVKVLESAEIKMGGVFRGLGKSSVAEFMPRIMSWIASRKKTSLEELLQASLVVLIRWYCFLKCLRHADYRVAAFVM